MEEIRAQPMNGFVKSEAVLDLELKVEEEYYITMDDMDAEISPDKFQVQGSPKSSGVYDLILSQPTKDVYSPMRCRLCALPNTVMVDIFSSEEVGNNIVEKIEYCLCIVIEQSDPLPKQVCLACLDRLEMCYKFNETVAEAEIQLLADFQQPIGKIDGTESNRQTPLPCLDHDRVGGERKTENHSTLEIRSESTTIPEEVQTTNNTAVKSRPSLPRIKPCSVVLVPTDIRLMNKIVSGDSRAKTDSKSPATTKDEENRGSNKPVNVRRRRHRCISCPKMFESRKSLVEHEKIHTDNGVYSCKFCRKKFDDILDQRRHLLSHTVERPLRCSVCAKKFSSKASRDRHHFTHTGEQPYKCYICGRRFNTKQNRDRHHRIHARENYSQVISRPQACRKIPVTCREKKIKDSRMKNPPNDGPADNGHRRYKCDSCSKTFKTRQYLTWHTRLHTGEGLYSCDYCGKKFITRWKRDFHFRIHTGERPFKCTVCDKDFKTKANRDRHHLIHKRNDFYKSISNSEEQNH